MKKGMEPMVDDPQAALEPLPTGPKSLAPIMDDGIDPWDDTVEATVRTPLPILKIAYGLSKGKPDACADGQMFNASTGNVMDEVKFIWLTTKVSNFLRNKFDTTASTQAPVLCQSDNGMYPTGGVEQQPGPCRRKVGNKVIDVCPMLKWQDDPAHPGKSLPPACFAACPMLCFDVNTATPFIFTPSRSGMKHFKALKTRMRALKGQMTDPDRPDIPGFLRTPIVLRTVKSGIHFEPVFEILSDPKDRAPVEWGEALRAQLAAWKSQFEHMGVDQIADSDVPVGTNGDTFQPQEDGSVL